MSRLAPLVLIVALLGCGEHGSLPRVPPDAGSPDAPDSMPVVDAPDPAVSVRGGCAGLTEPITKLVMPQTELGQTAMAWIEVANPAHRRLLITPGAMLGAELDPNDTRDPVPVRVAFHPQAVGPVTTSLMVGTVGGSESIVLPVTAEVVPAAGLLQVNTPAEHLGINQPNFVVLTNRSSATPIALDAPVVTSDDSTASDVFVFAVDCTAILLPGDSCRLNLENGAAALGCRRGQLSVHGSTNTVHVALDAPAVLHLNIGSYGGTVTDSSGTCSNTACAHDLRESPVILTAAALPGSRFVAWDNVSGCTTESVCNFSGDNSTVSATFAPASAKTITINFAGPGKGRVIVLESGRRPVVCDQTCTVSPVDPAATLKLVASATSSFGGWTGDCAGTSVQCNLGVSAQDRAVTATFDTDSQELAAVFPPTLSGYLSTTRGGPLPGGDVLVAIGTTMARITLGGAVVWRQRALVRDLVTTPSGEIVELGAYTPLLTKRDANGLIVWSRAVGYPLDSQPCFGESSLAVLPDGNIGVLVGETVRVVDATTGADVWKATATGCRAIAADRAGNVAIGVDIGTDTYVKRFSPTGIPLPGDWMIGAAKQGFDMVFDAQNALITKSTGDGGSIVTRRDAAGTLVFTRAFASDQWTSVLAVTPAGNVVVADVTSTPQQATVRILRPTGSDLSTLIKAGFASPTLEVALIPQSLTIDAAGRLLMLGKQSIATPQIAFQTGYYEWAEVLQIP